MTGDEPQGTMGRVLCAHIERDVWVRGRVRHMTICGKIVEYISGHKQFDVASAISNFKKILS